MEGAWKECIQKDVTFFCAKAMVELLATFGAAAKVIRYQTNL